MKKWQFPNIILILFFAATLVSCATSPKPIPSQQLSCSPAQLSEFNPFYGQMDCATGIPILAARTVNPHALAQAKNLVNAMLESAPQHAQDLANSSLRIAIIGEGQVTTDIPEYEHLRHDKTINWNRRARGLGATKKIPVVSVGEENLLCLPRDRYAGEDIFVHEFAHSLIAFMPAKTRKAITADIKRAFKKARQKGLYSHTYAGSNHREYFAEGVQSYFNVNNQASPPDGIHNEVNTRAELKRYDPTLYAIIQRLFNTAREIPSCHNKQILRNVIS